MAGPEVYDWLELITRLEQSWARNTPPTLDHGPTRRILHSNMLHLRNANGGRLKSLHKISIKHFPTKRREAKFVPFGIWRMMFFRRLAWVRMNEPSPDGTSPDIAAALCLDLNGLPTSENMVPYVDDNGTHIFDGNHDNFIDLFLSIDEIFGRLRTPTNQQWIQHAIQQGRIRFRNLEQLRTILRGTAMPESLRHVAFAQALGALFNADGSPTSSDPFEFLQFLMDAREQIVADLAVLQDLHKHVTDVDTFLIDPEGVVSCMDRLAGISGDSCSTEVGPCDGSMTNQQADLLILHERFKLLRIVWIVACQKTQNPHHKLSLRGPIVRERARHYFDEFMTKDKMATELTLADMDLWI